jgi:hypothetical protein
LLNLAFFFLEGRERERVVRMGILQEDVVVISQAEKPGEPAVITVNCPDKTGLGCDLCRVILLFGLSICREGKFFFFFNVFEIINFELL